MNEAANGNAASAARTPDRFDRALGYACAAPLFLIVALTFFDVFARYLFASPVQGSAEIVQFLMALTIFAALPLITRHHQNISISMVDGLLKGAARRAQQVLIDLASFSACGVIAWQLVLQANEYARIGNKSIVLGLPMAPLTYVMAAFAAATCAVIALQVWKGLRR